MTNTADLNLLADILLPAAQDWTPLWWAASFILPALLAALVVFLAHKRRRKDIAPQTTRSSASMQELNRIEREWQSGALPPREVAYRLAAVLRIGMGLAQLTRQPPPSVTVAGSQATKTGAADSAQDALWQRVIDELERIRYCPDGGQVDPQWFEWIRGWLQTKESARA